MNVLSEVCIDAEKLNGMGLVHLVIKDWPMAHRDTRVLLLNLEMFRAALVHPFCSNLSFLYHQAQQYMRPFQASLRSSFREVVPVRLRKI